MHEGALRFVCQQAAYLPAGVSVYEIGSRNINGSARAAFPHACRYYGIDMEAGPDVDAVANGTDHVPPFVPEVVLCCEVLEHTPDAARICQQAHTVLSAGGSFIATMAGPRRQPHSAIDGGPLRPGEFYRNWDVNLVADWCVSFTVVCITLSANLEDMYLLCSRLRKEARC